METTLIIINLRHITNNPVADIQYIQFVYICKIVEKIIRFQHIYLPY
jgi:hypothetical protein